MIQARSDLAGSCARSMPSQRMTLLPGAAGIPLLMAVLLIVGILNGCGAGRPTKYYQLTIPAAALPAEHADSVPITLVLGVMLTSHLYREDRIIYGNGGEELGAYEYQRWVEPPAGMIQDILLRELRNSGRYRAVYYRRSGVQGDFALRGRLYDFNEVDGNPLSARVTFELEMRNLKTGVTVWTHYYTHDEPVASKNVNAIVTAIDRNAQKGVAEMVASLNEYFAANPVK